MPGARIEEILRRDSIRSMRIQPVAMTPSSARLHDVVAAMQKQRVAAVVVSDNDRVVGIFTERDLLNRIVGLALNEHLTIGDVMTPEPRTLSPDDRIADAIRLMTERGYRHVPLVDDKGKGVGLISARDVVEFVARHYPKEVLNLPPDLNQVMRQVDGG
ncbi:MAG: CBS domain-containing protein [Candidatus Polarisedimenticolia bacterium]